MGARLRAWILWPREDVHEAAGGSVACRMAVWCEGNVLVSNEAKTMNVKYPPSQLDLWCERNVVRSDGD